MTDRKKWMTIARKLTLIFILLIILYLILMFFAYIFPASAIRENWTESVQVINGEAKRWEVLTGFAGTKLDTFTDNLIYQRMLNEAGNNPLYASMWNDGYVRYWMGIISIVRPLTLFINYSGIRFLNIFLIMGLMFLVMFEMSHVFGKIQSFLFLLTMGLIHFWIFPLSLQYTPVYVILMVAIYSVIKLYKKDKLTFENSIILFFVVGSVTNYLDLLTAPLLTFGLPFVILFSLKIFNRDSLLTIYMKSCVIGLTWLFSYCITWVAKWVIGSVFTGQNIIANAIQQVFLRTAGTEEEVLSVSEIMSQLFNTMFPPYAIVILVGIVTVWLVLFIKSHKTKEEIFRLVPLLLLSLLPIAWFLLLQNHNQHHYYFTYRNLAISVLSILTFMNLSIRWKRKNNIKRVK